MNRFKKSVVAIATAVTLAAGSATAPAMAADANPLANLSSANLSSTTGKGNATLESQLKSFDSILKTVASIFNSLGKISKTFDR